VTKIVKIVEGDLILICLPTAILHTINQSIEVCCLVIITFGILLFFCAYSY